MNSNPAFFAQAYTVIVFLLHDRFISEVHDNTAVCTYTVIGRAHHRYTTGAKFGHCTLTHKHCTCIGCRSDTACMTCGFASKLWVTADPWPSRVDGGCYNLLYIVHMPTHFHWPQL